MNSDSTQVDTHGIEAAELTVVATRHPCNACHQTYKTKATLNQHLRLSSCNPTVQGGTKPVPKYACKACDKRYYRQDNLEYHLKAMHPQYETTKAYEEAKQQRSPKEASSG